MLSNILLGTPKLTVGNLALTTRAAGKRGESCTFAVVEGTPLAVTVIADDSAHGFGKADIVVTAPTATTEAELIALLNASLAFRKVASVEQASGDGTDEIEFLAQQNFPIAIDGLITRLQTKVSITGWDDRDVIATGAPVGLLMPMESQLERESRETGGFDYYKGTVLVAVAFQHDTAFQEQNATLDLFRRAAFQAIKFFDHPDLFDKQIKAGYGNVLRDEASGTAFEKARLRVAAELVLQWQEPAYDAEDLTTAPFARAETGLFREPLDSDVAVEDDGEVKDQDIIVEP
ncbi:MAG: hypothetical protein HY231_23805 [Acidobacteria bacterium]|nr:hypothetical protein [Acidobacteriota bacterium]